MRTETFDTPGEVKLDIRLGAGEIAVETTDVRETTVTLEPLRDDEGTAAAIANARVELRERGSRQEVLIDVRSRGRFSRSPEVLVNVICPEGASLESKSGSANVEGRGRFGSIEVQSGSGDIEFAEITADARVDAASGDVELGNVGGDVRVNTASGDLQARSIGGDAKVNSASGDVIIREVGGELSVNTASGDLLVREVRGPLTANTASGDTEIGAVRGPKVTIKSASGDIKVGIPEGAVLWVDARSRSGDVSSALPVSELPPEGNGTTVELRANSMSGDIEIVRA